MNTITFILGGVRSGKSIYAVKLAKKYKGKTAFVATCSYYDKEMKKRIKTHKENRPSNWTTFEDIKDMPKLLKKICPAFKVVVVDCLTLFVSSLMLNKLKDDMVEKTIREMLKVLKASKCKTIIVSNEVGLGVVPVNRLARKFRDLAGKINQKVADEADTVLFMVSGIPLKVKGRAK